MVIQQASVIDFLANNGELKHLQEIFNDYHELSIYGLGDGQRTLVAATLLARQQSSNLLVLCDTQKRAKELWEDLGQLMVSFDVLYFPALEMIP